MHHNSLEHKHEFDSHASSFHRPDTIDSPLYVISPIFNPIRYRARWKHYNNFEKHVVDSGARLFLIELSFGNREEVYKEERSEKITIIHIRTSHELWLKENLINVATQFLPKGWEYMAYIDADMQFARPDWVGETLHQLQHHPIVQMFSEVAYLSPEDEVVSMALSFMEGWRRGIPFKNKQGEARDEGWSAHRRHHHDHCFPEDPYSEHNHHHKIAWAGAPGGAWAYRREALNHLGGLIDWAILGSADYHMATALMGFLHISLQKGYHPEYIQLMMDWQDRALLYIKRNVGHVKGLLLHHWHGKMKDRNYDTRWKILIKHQFNPRIDLKKDTNGVWQLTDQKWQLRDDIRNYFRQRNEDSIDR